MLASKCPNPSCQKVNTHGGEFCEVCGTRLPPYADVAVMDAIPGDRTTMRAGKGVRIGAFAIDYGILVLLFPILSPFPFVYGLVGVAYLLLRDVNGASLGKMILGCRVVAMNGDPATTSQLILRNLIFVLDVLASIIPIPFLGALASMIGFVGLALIELIALLATGERIGDKIASTMVVKKKQ